ncbi:MULTISPECIES: hypothetical protein [Pseudomonas]|uniref:Uncharacterized conserved protein n=3 Tax=Pseudomonas syringae group TaxID=136849 RepID=Q0EE05_PSESF|nr:MULTISPECIES: hypothetical protein [Pseudomonas]EPM92004.1 hypothetical protein A259_37801 [Pseudomonas syringae pv. actinidiae ICMP 19070]AAZ99816.1 Ptx22 [Pseudomonas savastanoi pv. phaseolicola]AQL39522.1 hypothetical protein JN853_25895 [Pseudomonas syringae pv. actinidiae ICMP 9853]EGH66953.1 hypothetical protein PSYAC_19005 [Pseudomonas syringae pv. actinidiae str. M302091]EPM44982.1 hypothetical protein A256_25873 [Pseudomonas syringae pv. actinidiae ICMP 19103]
MSGIAIGIVLTLSLTASRGGRAQSIVDLLYVGGRSHLTLLLSYLAFDLINSLVALVISEFYSYLVPFMLDWLKVLVCVFFTCFAAVNLYKVFAGAAVSPEFGEAHGFRYILASSLKNYGLWFDALFPIPLLIVFFARAGFQSWQILAGMMLGYVGWYTLLVGVTANKLAYQNLMWFAATCIMVLIDCVLIGMLLFYK